MCLVFLIDNFLIQILSTCCQLTRPLFRLVVGVTNRQETHFLTSQMVGIHVVFRFDALRGKWRSSDEFLYLCNGKKHFLSALFQPF